MDELIDRARRGEASTAELVELDAWRRVSAANERQYRDTVRLLDVARALGHDGPSRAVRPTARAVIERANARARRAWRVVMRRAPWGVAAAAVIIAVVAVRSRVASDVDRIAGWTATEVVTGSTELATVQLGEGSVVRLGPSSRLRVLAGRGRAVSLEGRAFFAVHRMPDHPLRVQTVAGEARVLGTRFEIATEGDGLHVRVVEGRVALSTSSGEVEVAAGEESGVRSGAVTSPTPLAAPATVAAWAGTFLAFQATPLRDVARDIERVYHTPVTIGDSALAAETITATFTDRPVAEVVNVVCAVLSATCAVRGGKVRIDR